MIRKLDTVNIFSNQPRALAQFYSEKVGLPQPTESEMGDDGGEYFLFEMEGCDLAIITHSQIEGRSKEPQRIVLSIEGSDIEEDCDRLIKAGVKQIEEPYHMEGYGFVSTFEDVDGNYFQIVQVRASGNQGENHNHGHDGHDLSHTH